MKQIAAVETKRLTAIADMLVDVQEDHFDLGKWGQDPIPAKIMFFGLIELRPACGFSGCAMGWAAYNRLFPGLVWRGTNISYTDSTGDKHYGFYAASVLLGISYNMACYLFHPDSYLFTPTTNMVEQRIRRFVKKIEAIRERERNRVVSEVQLPERITRLMETVYYR